MSALDLKALREIAEKATPGPWKTVSSHVYRMGEDGANVCSASDPWVSTIVGYYKPQIDSQKGLLKAADNAAYIAAFNPSTALALLDRIEEQAREIERLKAERQWQPIEAGPDESVPPWDGNPVLILTDHRYGSRVHRAIWTDEVHGNGIHGWAVEDCKFGPYALRGYMNVTHWMPLPAALRRAAP